MSRTIFILVILLNGITMHHAFAQLNTEIKVQTYKPKPIDLYPRNDSIKKQSNTESKLPTSTKPKRIIAVTYSDPINLQKKWFATIGVNLSSEVDLHYSRDWGLGASIDIAELGLLSVNVKYVNPKHKTILEFDAAGILNPYMDYGPSRSRIIYSPILSTKIKTRIRSFPDGTYTEEGYVSGNFSNQRSSTFERNFSELDADYAKLRGLDIGIERNIFGNSASYADQNYSGLIGYRRTRVTNIRYKLFDKTGNDSIEVDYYKDSPRKQKKYAAGFPVRIISTFKAFVCIPVLYTNHDVTDLSSPIGGGIAWEGIYKRGPLVKPIYRNTFMGFEVTKNLAPNAGLLNVIINYGLSF